MKSRSNSAPPFKRGAAVLAAALALFVTASARADECAFLSGWRKVVASKAASYEKIATFNAFMARYDQAMENAAHALFKAYRAGAKGDAANRCFESKSDLEIFNQKLARIFLSDSVDELAQLGDRAPVTTEFITLVRAKIKSGEITAFRLVGHDEIGNPTGNAGGYHRANHSIFMDLGIIPGSQWLIVLAHELAHAVDAELAGSLPVYNDPKKVEQIAQWARSRAPLSQEQTATLDSWLLAGLQRGLLTEMRAWAKTLEIYREGLVLSRWPRIEWIESAFGALADPAVPAPSDWNHATLEVLSPRFTNPSEGIFSLPVIQQRIETIRADLLKRD